MIKVMPDKSFTVYVAQIPACAQSMHQERSDMSKRLSHVIGFDDAPFERAHRGDVLVVGTVFSGARLDGVLSTRVRRDGANATDRLAACINASKFHAQLHAVLLQGIAFAGFNVVDLETLHRDTGLPVLVVARRRPSLAAIRRALLNHVPGGKRKWQLIEAAGPMASLAGVYVQRQGIAETQAQRLIEALQINGLMPEPLRVAHMIAGGVTTGESRHRA
jgi:endonuclease V-like protein UPF0215 family